MPSATTAAQAPPAAPGVSADNSRALPSYQTPVHPLSRKHIDQLAQLKASEYNQQVFLKKYEDGIRALGEDGSDISERLFERRELIARSKTRRARDGKEDAEVDAAEQAELEDLEQKVTSMRERMEAALRGAIDGRVAVEQLVAVHRETLQSANEDAQAAAASQAQSQTQTLPQVTQDGETPAPATQPAPSALLPLFEEKFESQQDRYQARSMYQRYGEHNDYKNFKRMMHHSLYPAETQPPPLAHATRWFADAEPPPGVTSTAHGGVDGDDEDLVVGSVRISTKCPLTLREFEEPVTSKKCPHSFERSAIFGLLERERPPTRRAGGQDQNANWRPETQCPVPGCEQRLGEQDLERDDVLVRRIKRMQRARELLAEEQGGSPGARRSQVQGDEIDSGSESEADDIDAVTQRHERRTPNIKRERMSQSRRGNSAAAGDDIENDDSQDEDEDMTDA